LERLGWRVAIVWECATRSIRSEEIAHKIHAWLRSSAKRLTISGTC
jgi:G:T-mismatch repair DNA endonuclease (very short patch repair protein)